MERKITGIVPVKLSERLPGKHLLRFGGRTLLETVVDKLSMCCPVRVYSKIPLPIPYVKDASENIMHLLSLLSGEYGEFLLVAGDMPFFTENDIRLLISKSAGKTTVPRHANGQLEPLFAKYSGRLEPGRNLESMIHSADAEYIDAQLFSPLAFFNVNTMDDYLRAIELLNVHGMTSGKDHR